MKTKFKTIILAGLMASMSVMSAFATDLVKVDLWNKYEDQASMGNVATEYNEKGLYNPDTNILQVALNPVNISGFKSGVTAVRYDSDGKGKYVDVKTLSTGTIESGTIFDGTNRTVTYLSSFEFELPSYLKKTGVEYIPIEMKVPYTPMDTVIGDGYLEARLRIDWSTKTDTPAMSIVSNNTVSGGEVLPVVLKDSSYTLTGDTSSLSRSGSLSVTTLTSGTDYERAKTAMGTSISDYNIVKVEVKENSTTMSINGNVTLNIPQSGDVAVYRINDSGTRTQLTGKQGQAGYDITSSNFGVLAIAKPDTPSFTDIDTHWAKDFVTQAVQRGLFSGTSTTTFSPDQQMTCSMAIAVLYRMAGSPDVANFKAVTNTWYEKAETWGKNNGIIGGYKTFEPDADVTREELATMIYKYHSLNNKESDMGDLTKYTDASKISSWSYEALQFANGNNIITGTTSTTISPEKSATRAEVATIFCRYLNNV